ncbi:MAG TPA: hypothetical protein VET83_10925 [Candidatus Dormibacteraeota bacterium]|nr:hypothetical protein [Candidatus Dormibacteraeota bacterium]
MRTYRFLAPAIVGALLFTASAAGATDRDYLKTKLSFRYIAQPNDTTSTPAVLDNNAIASGTETGAFWTNRNISGLQNLVRSLLREPARGGNVQLQSVVASVLKILDRPVMVRLLDDKAAPLTTRAYRQWEACPDQTGQRAWPCARNASTQDDQRAQCAEAMHVAAPPRRDASWAGSMTLGQGAFDAGNAGNPLGTFVHELVHTQDRSSGDAHMFTVSQHSYNYGSDGRHYYHEAMPNLAATYQEGIADAVMMIVDTASQDSLFAWFSRNDVLLVEKTLLAPGTGAGPAPCWTDVTSPSPDIWLYNQLHAAGVRELHLRDDPYPGYGYFSVRDLPPRFIVHNEFIIGLVFSAYAQHLGLQKFLDALKANDATLFRTCASSIAVLYDALGRAGLGARPQHTFMPPGGLSGRPDDGPKPWLIPLAYADYFTSYNATTKADYASIFENMLPQEWVDLYWDWYKARVRLAAPLGPTMPPRREHLTDIATALGVTTSTPDPLGFGAAPGR